MVVVLIDLAKTVGDWIARTPLAIAFLIAVISVLLEFWLKINSRNSSSGGKLWGREDAVLWPNWVVSSFVAGSIYFLTPSTASPPPSDKVGEQVITLLAALFIGCTVPPFIAREKGYRVVPAAGGLPASQELRFFWGIFWPNAVGLVVLLVVVYSGVKSATG